MSRECCTTCKHWGKMADKYGNLRRCNKWDEFKAAHNYVCRAYEPRESKDGG